MTKNPENQKRESSKELETCLATIYTEDLTKAQMRIFRFKELLEQLNVVKNVRAGLIEDQTDWISLVNIFYNEVMNER